MKSIFITDSKEEKRPSTESEKHVRTGINNHSHSALIRCTDEIPKMMMLF